MNPFHLDDLTGVFVDAALQLLGPRAIDTRAELAAYEGLPLDVLFPPPASVPRVRVARRWGVPGMESEDLEFTSAHEPIAPGYAGRVGSAYGRNRVVWARRIRPAGSAGRPRLLYLHGFMQPETLVEEGAIVAPAALALRSEIVQVQPAFHGRRSPAGTVFGGELFWTADLVRSIEALRQTLLDARAMLSWMLAEDPRPVGLAGLSLGGALTLGLACLDERFDFAIPLIAHADLARMVSDAPVLHTMRRQMAGFGWTPDDFRGFVERIGWYAMRPRIAPERIHLFAASDDRFFDAAVVDAMARDWGIADLRWYPTSHMGFVLRLPGVGLEMRRLVDRYAGEPR